MTENEYMAGASSPVSGVSHLFDAEEVQQRELPAGSLCGAVGSYGQFQPTSEVPEDEVCQNCVRVRERREDTPEGEADA